MIFDYREDGITHINVYSKANTWLGQQLSNFALTPFTHPTYGRFSSVEGLWYWLSCKDDKLKNMYGYKAKQYGRSVGAEDWLDSEEFKTTIKEAISLKILNNTKLKQEFIKSTLPFTHYYVYDNVIVQVPKGDWLIQFLETHRSIYK